MSSTITDVTVDVHSFDTPEREADGTLSWDATTAVVVVLRAEGATGLGLSPFERLRWHGGSGPWG